MRVNGAALSAGRVTWKARRRFIQKAQGAMRRKSVRVAALLLNITIAIALGATSLLSSTYNASAQLDIQSALFAVTSIFALLSARIQQQSWFNLYVLLVGSTLLFHG